MANRRADSRNFMLRTEFDNFELAEAKSALKLLMYSRGGMVRDDAMSPTPMKLASRKLNS